MEVETAIAQIENTFHNINDKNIMDITLIENWKQAENKGKKIHKHTH